MARPADISEQEIIAAGEALLQAQRSVTGFALRTYLKGGNAPRLKSVWEQHLEKGRVHDSLPLELPVQIEDRLKSIKDDVASKFDTIAADLHQLAERTAKGSVGELVRSLEERRALADREMHDASETVEDLESKLAEANSLLESRNAELESLHTTSQAQAVELSAANEKLHAATQQIERLTADIAAAQKSSLDSAKLQGRVEELERQNAGLLSKLSVTNPTSS